MANPARLPVANNTVNCRRERQAILQSQNQSEIMEVICIESEAFYNLIKAVINKIIAEQEVAFVWVDEKQAMKLLGISSKTTLQKLRNNDSIRFSQPMKKKILYDKISIDQYLSKNANY